MLNKYFTFLYSECKRSSTVPVDSQQVKDFINSPEGQRGFLSFCKAFTQQSKTNSRPQSAHELFKGYHHE